MTDIKPVSDWKRVLLKLSGEALMGDLEFGIDVATVDRFATDIGNTVKAGTELAVVVGGGNIYRGMAGAAAGMDRANGDYMGMLATVMNALALHNALERQDIPARVLSSIPMPSVCEPFIRQKAIRHLKKGRVVIFAAGTGNPFFTTDTGAALRAIEMQCDGLAKATQVDGVYSADPRTDPDATRYERVTYGEVLAKNLQVMDGAAIALARDNELPVVIFSLQEEGNITRVLHDALTNTIVHS
ncbi:MAG: UMP kinase [Hyphomicrobiaceae bacterium]|nr:UMP kinase [Hyphomicrobiaceae bacterium]